MCADAHSSARYTCVGERQLGISSFWVVVSAVAVIEVGIVVAALRMKTVNSAGSILGSRPAEALWTLLPVTLLATLAVLSYRWLSDS